MQPYVPCPLPIANLDYHRLFALVGEANAELALYDGLLQGIVNPSVMLSPLANEEAVLSSRIEGTQATVDEVLEQEAGLIKEGEKGKDIQEIINYREAMLSAQGYLVDIVVGGDRRPTVAGLSFSAATASRRVPWATAWDPLDK